MFNKKLRRCNFDLWLETLVEESAAVYSRRAELNYWCDISATRETEYITYAFENAEAVFAKYSNLQITDTLWHLIGVASDKMFILLDKRVTWKNKKRCIYSFIELNKELFAKRCSPLISHLGRVGNPDNVDNPLNSICYMWWDSFRFWGSVTGVPNRIDDLFFEVMVETLKIDHVACQEASLHGLNHIPGYRMQVKEVVEQFLRENPNLSSELREYAIVATWGGNQ